MSIQDRIDAAKAIMATGLTSKLSLTDLQTLQIGIQLERLHLVAAETATTFSDLNVDLATQVALGAEAKVDPVLGPLIALLTM